jgi:hypothetical protein
LVAAAFSTAAMASGGPVLAQTTTRTQAASRTQPVTFPAGASGTRVEGRIQGDAFVDYRLRAAAGQTLSVNLTASNPQNYFNLNPPDSDRSMFVGSVSGNRFQGLLPADGTYTVRVYLMRPAARRGESSRYGLDFRITGKPLAPVAVSSDALIPGTPFHASAQVSCSTSIGPTSRRCEAFVTRRGFDGTATVEVRWPDGARRRVLFVKGKPVASDAPDPLTVQRRGDLSVVTVGSDLERYEIPDALVTGG